MPANPAERCFRPATAAQNYRNCKKYGFNMQICRPNALTCVQKDSSDSPKTPFCIFERYTNSTISRLVDIKSVMIDLDSGT